MCHKRVFVLLFGLAMLAVTFLFTMLMSLSTSHAAPSEALAAIKPDQYFPLEVGNQWLYSWENTTYVSSPFVERIVVIGKTTDGYILNARHHCASGWANISTISGYQWTSYGSAGCSPFPIPRYMLIHVYTRETIPRVIRGWRHLEWVWL